MTITDFDSIFLHIGGFGRYQMLLFGANCLMCSILAFVYFGQFFMTLTPPHWCRPPAEVTQLNLTPAEVKRLTIPVDSGGGDFQRCARYQVDFRQVVESNDSWPNTSWPTTSCTNGWQYDYSLYYPTITSQLDWVCDEDWKATLSQSLFFVGSLVGSPVLGWAADAWGRLPVIVLTNVVGGVAGICSAFCSSFVSFTIFRFIVGMTYDTHYNAVYILLLEYVSTEYRSIMGNVPILTFLTGAMCAMPWVAWGLADWSLFAVAMHTPQLFCLFFYWMLPESARWLLGQGRVEDTVRIIRRAAKVNGRTLSPRVLQDLQDFGERRQEENVDSVTVLDLVKTPVLRRRFFVLCLMWVTVGIAYDAHMRNTANIGPNVFFTFTLAGFVELPADLLTMLFMEKLGRRHTLVWTVVVGGFSCLAVAATPVGEDAVIMVLAMVGRFMITMAMNVGMQYQVEVLPTVARAQGMAFIHTVGFLAAFVSPYIVYLSKFGHLVPYTILGAVTIGGGAVCVLLPETLDQNLPDSLHDGETFFGDQTFCYNPCANYPQRVPPLDKELPLEEAMADTPLQGYADSHI
ncbi:solute carrier family 22 member 21-like [Penaeus japonicus]|uniref:solute carrier family 22 member 21-like n=1 Tax=Penaeus japonicus TaxID=27405 RepID=UPI001C7124CC|nr:solute carrier family 22 member 21-like [Penaeus japonicus]